MGNRNIRSIVFNPWVIIGSILVGFFLLAITLISLSLIRPGSAPTMPGTAVITIIAAQTDTPVPPTQPVISSPTPVQDQTGINLGGSVEIAATGGDGLRLRFSPGLQNKVRILGAEGEVFLVVDGPQAVDDYIWWYLESPKDPERRGWAVADFLRPILSP